MSALCVCGINIFRSNSEYTFIPKYYYLRVKGNDDCCKNQEKHAPQIAKKLHVHLVSSSAASLDG